MNHAQVEMNPTKTRYINVEAVEYVYGYKLRLTFNDGTARTVDFEPFLRNTQHPDFIKYRALRRFRSYRIEHGNLMWGDFELIFPIMDLYRGIL
jgi:hypothetical protein